MKRTTLLPLLFLLCYSAFSHSIDGGYSQGLVNLVPDTGFEFKNGFKYINPSPSLGFWRLSIVPQRLSTGLQEVQVALNFSIDQPTDIRGNNANGGEALYKPSDFSATVRGSMNFIIEGTYTDPTTNKQYTFENKKYVSELGSSTINSGLFTYGPDIVNTMARLKITQEADPLAAFLNTFKVKVTSIKAISRNYQGFASMDNELGKRLEQKKTEAENKMQAEAYLRQGHVQYGIRDYQGAKELYQKAYALNKSPETLQLVEDADKALKAEQERLKNESAETNNNGSTSVSSPILTSTSPSSTQTNKNNAVQNKNTTSTQNTKKTNKASNDIYSKAEQAGKTLEQMKYEREAYQRQQRDKLRYATNPGAYYLERSGIWNNYNSMLNSIAKQNSREQGALDRQWNDEQRRIRLERLRREREAAQQKAQYDKRSNLLTSLPANGLPWSGINIDTNKLYYFVYHYTGNLGDIEQITFSNIFSIGQYPDGSWPDRKKVLGHIYEASIDPNKYVNVSHRIIGFYTSEAEAQTALTNLKSQLSSTQLNINTFQLQGANSNVTPGKNKMSVPLNLLFSKASELFDQNQFKESLEAYLRGLQQTGGTFPEGLYKTKNMDNMGYIYYSQENYAEALSWFEKGAENGSVYSLRSLAHIYTSGIGAEKNTEKAAELLQKAWELGDLQSEVDLALLHFENSNTQMAEKLMSQVVNNYTQPIEVRNQLKLQMAKAYAYGTNGFPKSIFKSNDLYVWLIDEKVLDASYQLVMVGLDKPNGYTSEYYVDAVVNNPEQSIEKRNTVRLAYADAILSRNDKLKFPIKKALDYYTQLKSEGYGVDEALGIYFIETNDIPKARELHANSPFSGLYEYEGTAGKQNFEKALSIWETYSKQGNRLAKLFLATAYFSGNGVERSMEKATSLYHLAENQTYKDMDAVLYFLKYSSTLEKRFPQFSRDRDAFWLHLITVGAWPANNAEVKHARQYSTPPESGLYMVIEKDLPAYQAKRGFMDQNGEIIIPVVYDIVNDVGDDGLAIVKYKGKYGLIDRQGMQQVPVLYETLRKIADDLYQVTQDGVTFYVGSDGEQKIVHKNQGYQEIREFGTNGLAAFKLNNKWGFIDETGKEIVPATLQYDYVSNFSEDLAQVKKDGKWGYINVEGKEVIEPTYVVANRFINGKAEVKLKKDFYYIDKNGKKVKK